MAGEAVLQIGAVLDKDGVDTGMTDVAEVTKQTMAQITAVVEQAGAATRKAFKGLSEDVKLAAESVSADSLKIAEATKAQTAAMADLRRASIIARDAKVDDAVSTQILAAAQQQVAIASAELVASKKEEAAAVAEAAEKESLSNNAIIASFQRVARAVMESTEVMREQMVETAESAELSAEGIQAGFGGLGKLLGAGLIIGFATHFLDEAAKVDVELGHLSAKTGIAARSLAGLQQLVKESGGDWEAVATGLIKMDRALGQVELGNKKTAAAFKELGVSMEDVMAPKTPEHLEAILQKIAIAMANSKDQARLVNDAITVFGKGGAALIPMLQKQAAALKANTDAAADQVGVTDEGIAASERWTEEMAKFSAGFKMAGNVVIEKLHYVEGTLLAVDAAFTTLYGSIYTGWLTLGKGAFNFARIMHDAMTGNFGAIQGDWNQLTASFANDWKERIDQIKHDWQTVSSELSQPHGVKEKPDQDSAGSKDADETLKQDEAELNHLKILHHMSVAEEVKFWKDKLAAVKAGSDEYTQLEAKLAPLMERLRGEAGRGKGTKFGADELELNEQKLVHRLSIGDEIDFWEKKKNAAAKGSEEYREIVAKLASLAGQKDKPEMQQQPDGDWAKLAQEQMIQGLEAESKAEEEANKAGMENFRAAQEDKIRAAEETFQELESSTRFEVEMGRKTEQERLTELRGGAAEELQIKRQATAAMIILDMNVGKAYQQDINRSLQASREYFKQIQQLNQQSALHIQTNWNKVFEKLNADMLKTMDAWMSGTRNMSQVFAKMYDDMLKSLVAYVGKSLLVHAEMWAHTLALQLSGNAMQAAMNMQNIKVDAATAAANTYNAVSAIPIIGPALAPAAAAVAYGAVMAFETFGEGGVVSGRNGFHVPVLAHAGERILSPSQTQNFHSLVNNQQSSQKSGGDTHLNLTQNVNAYDRSGMRSTLRAHASDLYDIINDGMRSGALGRP